MAASTLADRTIESIARYIATEKCNNNVFVLAGAGISTSAGIPDFRSPKTGLYANLAKLNLPYPEAVFDIHYFRANPQPFYTLARDIAPGTFRPTPAHAFIRLLHEKRKLHTCFTQNIDTLERLAGVPPEKIIEAHGSFASSRCIDCKTPYDDTKMKQAISKGRAPRCEDDDCGGLVKPDIVFFGESLPPEFVMAVPALRTAALVIIMGTSLKVHPFAMLPNLAPREGCPRLLLNLEPAGNIGVRTVYPSSSGAQRSANATNNRSGPDSSDEESGGSSHSEEEADGKEETPAWVDDVVHLGDCDKSVRELCDLLGWREQLEQIWKGLGGVGGGSANSTGPVNSNTNTSVSSTERVDTAVDKDKDDEQAGKRFGSIEPDESANKRQRDQLDSGATRVRESGEGGDLAAVSETSVEKTLGVIIQDMEGALKLSANKEEGEEGDHSPGGTNKSHERAVE